MTAFKYTENVNFVVLKNCNQCAKEITYSNNRFGNVSKNNCKENFYTAFQLCEECANAYEAIIDAQSNGRRFQVVWVFPDERCSCGSAGRGINGYCIPCSINKRMLDKASSEVNFTNKLLRQLRKEIKEKENYK